MALAHSRVTAQGQISIPAEIRRKLGIGPGSVLEWEEDGHQIVVQRAGRFGSEDIHQELFGERTPEQRSVDELKGASGITLKSVMRAVDTNVLVRLITRDHPRQVASAESFIENGAWLSILALAEATRVLATVYGLGPGRWPRRSRCCSITGSS